MFAIAAGHQLSNKHKRTVNDDGSYGTCPHYGSVSISVSKNLSFTCQLYMYYIANGGIIHTPLSLQYVTGERGDYGTTGPKVRLLIIYTW